MINEEKKELEALREKIEGLKAEVKDPGTNKSERANASKEMDKINKILLAWKARDNMKAAIDLVKHHSPDVIKKAERLITAAECKFQQIKEGTTPEDESLKQATLKMVHDFKEALDTYRNVALDARMVKRVDFPGEPPFNTY